MIKYVLLALILGGIAGYLSNNFGKLFDNAWVSNYAFEFSLLLLLFAMGFTFGMDKEAVGKLRKKGFKILIVPFSIALGSIFGGLVGGY
ncbi:lysine exporter LysO family protein, partial [Candidatus Bathyarchaeota archaeon]|nr:lysine exporter LysO family protein [Candidatus Bathyarchaeota archaeon]